MENILKKTCRAQLTRLIKSADDYIKNESNGQISESEVRVLIARITAAKESLSYANEKAMSLIEEDKMEEECEKIFGYDDAAVTCLAKLQHVVERVTSSSANAATATGYPQASASTRYIQETSVAEQRDNKLLVRLPKLNLLKFNGDLHAWPAFWEQFSANIHERQDLDNTVKFSYLKSLLTGQAAVTINGLTTSHANYEDAISMLKEEFGNNELIIDTYIQNLLALQPVKNRNDILSLRKLYNTTSTITRSLQSLGVSNKQYGMMVKSILLKAIPYSMRIEYNKRKQNREGEFSDASSESTSAEQNEQNDVNLLSCTDEIEKLLRFLKIEIDSVQKAQTVAGDREEKLNVNKNKFQTKDKKPCTAAGLFTIVKQNCLFCQSKDHLTANCNGPMSLPEKKELLKEKSSCFRCTKIGHNSRFCKTKIICEKCKRKHASSMCDPNYVKKQNSPKSTTENEEKATSLIANSNFNDVYLQTACAFITNGSSVTSAFIRLVFDGGSQITFIKECVSRKLNLKVVGTHKLSIVPFGSSKRTPAIECKRVLVYLKASNGNEIINIKAIEVPEICFDSLKKPPITDPIIKQFSNNNILADSVPNDQNLSSGISLLIGADNYWSIVSNENKKLSNNLASVNTKLGWTLLGTNEATVSANFSAAVLHIHVMDCEENRVNDNLSKFWDLETIGIKEDSDEKPFTESFIKNNIKFNGERYEVQLPWEDKGEKLDSNFCNAKMRVKNLTAKLIRGEKLIEYDNSMREYMENDCAERINHSENKSKLYYMPHRPVYRNYKNTTKLRIVFDASSHSPGLPSLNDMLKPGENLLPHSLRVLLNFRVGPIAITADIEKAFLQIELSESERDAHSFLWYDKPITKSNELPELSRFRMKRLTFGVTCCPFVLAATLKKHFLKQKGELAEVSKILLNSFYVDDLVVSLHSIDFAEKLTNQSKEILKQAKMNLRKWETNSDSLKTRVHLFEENGKTLKVLGIKWCTITDELSIDLIGLINQFENNNVTKRNVLQQKAKIYDPLGFLSPFVIKAKIILQDIWKLKLGWDEILPNAISNDWIKWINEVTFLNEYVLPRWVQTCEDNVELHVFADASQRAFGAVSYVRNISSNGKIECNFLMSKCRIAPISKTGENTLTLPKLELTAAVCSARMENFILKNLNLNISKVYQWTDSKIALYWIKGKPSRWKPYVSNRVLEIQKISKGVWKHCPGGENPADLLTRGVPAKIFMESELWRKGPSWLSGSQDSWPDNEEANDDPMTLNCLLQINSEKEDTRKPIFMLEKFSDYQKSMRITAYVLRFVNNLKNKNNKIIGNLTVEELKKSEIYWIQLIQENNFTEEVSNLRKKRSINSNSSILTLSPFLDELGILRLGGRLQESELPYFTKHPIILPKRSKLTEMLIWKSHIDTLHGGVNSTLTNLRRRFWIIQARQLIKTIIKYCVKCKNLSGKSVQEPFAPLPESRLKMVNPFKVSGIDFAGPLFVTNDRNKTDKTYVMLITCAVIRAVHLELVPDMTTESCLRALRRFISRRGVPDIIYSDNAKTFKRASLELKELHKNLRKNEVQNMAKNHRIEWRFIIERAAWWGGFWERLVRSVKMSLKLTLQKAKVNFDELRTILIEVEATINSRPLTYIDDDPDNLFILTPSHFLLGSNENSFYLSSEFKESKNYDIMKQWKIRESLVKRFWKRWRSDYLLQLRSVHGNKAVQQNSNFNVGDVALLHDQNLPRLLWKLVRITKVFTGRDGKIRGCEIKTGEGVHLRRPVQLLFPLEIPSAGEDVEN